ncbi:DUF4238 domain-containing protein [Bacillus cereus]|uniref:DUF4238 domain-containing protein n=1 Tax=Bacillus cereus TaxID=1396 RepID=UPI00397ED1E7
MAGNKHHFVPRLYLRRFNDNKENRELIWVFNKIYQEVKEKGLMGVGVEEFFYRFSKDEIREIKKEFMNEEIESNVLDDFFTNQIEPMFTQSLDKIIELYSVQGNQFILSDSDLPQLADCIAFQYLRTKSYRNGIKSNFENFLERILGNDSVAEILNFYDNRQVLEHAKWIFRRANILSEKLVKDYYWILYENHTRIPFYTSDSPVVAWALDRNGKLGQVIHETTFEIDEYSFPITNSLLLVLARKSEAIFEILNHGKVNLLSNEANVKFYNEGQLHSCFQQVFSSSNNFDMFNGLYGQLPNGTAPKINLPSV